MRANLPNMERLIQEGTTSLCQRRIVGGTIVDSEARYMVYMVEAPSSGAASAWLCGGCIVHPLFILTSASCLSDVKFAYAIAGYKKYVNSANLENDQCTKHLKKRVIETCTHKSFKLDKTESNSWVKWDIGFAKVESPYDFRLQAYLEYCSYKPDSIPISYQKQFQVPGIEVISLGWGHTKYYRPLSDRNDYNEKFLRYTSSIISDKSECTKSYGNKNGIKEIIEQYYICTDKNGHLDVDGNLTSVMEPYDGCPTYFLRGGNSSCNKEKDFIARRRTVSSLNDTFSYFTFDTRRNGICQNDHGGPLVTWIGGRVHVIGVATAFLVTNKMECVGPFIYSSVYCNSKFVYCIMNSQFTVERRSAQCEGTPEERGFDIYTKEIPWDDYSYESY